MVVFVEAEPAWRTHCCLPVKYEVIHPSAVEDKPKDKWSRRRRMSWSTVSNAADRSSSERREKFPESIARRMSERISARTYKLMGRKVGGTVPQSWRWGRPMLTSPQYLGNTYAFYNRVMSLHIFP